MFSLIGAYIYFKQRKTMDFNMKKDLLERTTMISSAIYVGDKLKLFNLMIDTNEPLTSTEIADKGNYKERYVREWLYLMVCGKIIDLANDVPHDKNDEQTFTVSQEYHDWHANHAGIDICLKKNLTDILTSPKDELIKCFSMDGPKGIGYDKYVGLQEWMDSYNKKTNIYIEVLKNINSIEGITEQLEKGVKVLEVGCGTGVCISEVSARFPNSTFHGFDTSEEAIRRAKECCRLDNLTFSVDDACSLPGAWSGRYTLVICWDVVHDIPRSSDALKEIARVLAPDGRVSVVEPAMSSYVRNNIDKPGSVFLYGASLFHCMPVSLYYPGGMGLGAAWGRELAEKMFDEAGLNTIQVRELRLRNQRNFTLAHK